VVINLSDLEGWGEKGESEEIKNGDKDKRQNKD
jgi:hypothetical protein